MRWSVLLLLPVLAGAAEIAGSNVRTIYVMPMPHGLDQYVANRLTRDRVLEVIADPARADAVLTGSLGKPLEEALEKLHPTPKPSGQDVESDSDDVESTTDAAETKSSPHSPQMMNAAPPPVSSWGSGKGTLFLVDARSRAILWSVYEKPRQFTSDELDRTAKRIVERLKKDLAGK